MDNDMNFLSKYRSLTQYVIIHHLPKICRVGKCLNLGVHLLNYACRCCVLTTREFLSFPKVPKSIRFDVHKPSTVFSLCFSNQCFLSTFGSSMAMAIQAIQPKSALHGSSFHFLFHSSSTTVSLSKILSESKRLYSVGLNPPRKPLKLNCRSNSDNGEQVGIFFIGLLLFFCFLFPDRWLVVVQDYLLDAPVSVGDGFSFSGGTS